MATLPPGTHIGPYEIASNPMIGGMGVVYFCLDHANDGRPVALKTFKPEYLPDRAARDRFLREGTAWVQLGRHPHIVRCYKVEYIDPTAFLVLELIAKEQDRDDASLRSWMGAPMPVEQALLFALQIARGMKHATEKIPGFVHRDLKPENVLVGADKLPETNINRLRITDFGLAAILQESSNLVDNQIPSVNGLSSFVPTRTHLTHGIVGTPLYMAPEQWKGEPVGVYTDVYALGCILHEMLTGKRVASGKTIRELEAMHCGGGLRLVLGDDLPSEVPAFLRRSLALAESERYQSWDEVTDAIQLLGVDLPNLVHANDSRAERRDAAYSYLSLGISYSHIGKAQIAMGYFENVLKISQEIGDQQGVGVALGNLGNAYDSLGDLRHAIGYYERFLTIAREIGDQRGEAGMLGNLGGIYIGLNDTRRAIEYFEESLKISREISNQRGESGTLNNLGLAYKDMGDTQRAIEYLEEALKIDRETGYRRGESAALTNLGSAYRDMGDADRAIEYLEEALKIDQEIGDRQGECRVLTNLGIAYEALGDMEYTFGFYEKVAFRYYEEACAIGREIGNINQVGIDSFNMARICRQQGKFKQAIPLAQEAIQIWMQIASPHLQQAQQLLSDLEDDIVSANLTHIAFDALMDANNMQEMRATVEQYPKLREKQFILRIEEAIKELPLEYKPVVEQRLTWLQQIIGN